MRAVVCIASGTSLTQDDVDLCQDKAIVYAVKECHLLAPWADALYAADGDWWQDLYKTKGGAQAFKGQRWTVDPETAQQYKLNCIPYKVASKWSLNPSYIATGGNSGFQALNLSVLLHAPERVILLGYDMGNTATRQKFDISKPKHWWTGKVQRGIRESDYPEFIKAFENAAPLIPVPVINCTRGGNLNCFLRMDLREALQGCRRT